MNISVYTLKLLGLVCFLALCTSCEDAEEPPENLLPRDTFVEVMVEVQLIEAIFNQNMIRNDEPKARIARYYKDSFEQFGVSREAFEATHEWYHKHPAELQNIYDEVISKLRQKQSALEGGGTETKKAPSE